MSPSGPEPKIGVVGAGLMGAEFALVFAVAGLGVFLGDSGSSSGGAIRAGVATLEEKCA
jgi:3-hydroxybutyryl-CoA dehydrogenase